jgi:hypothetical protein
MPMLMLHGFLGDLRSLTCAGKGGDEDDETQSGIKGNYAAG